MAEVLVPIFGSILIVSLISLLGILALSVREKVLKFLLIYLVAFAAGGLLGDAFFHLLPETVEEFGFGIGTGLALISGFAVFFLIEKVVHWHHFHLETPESHLHPITYTNLVGDALHNFIDGVIIAASYLVSIPLGIATTIAVIFHEIPQEIGDFAILVHGGYSKQKALLMNFLSALTAFIGAGVVLFGSGIVESLEIWLLPFAAGSFIYIASADLVPELQKEKRAWFSLGQFAALLAGVFVLILLLGLE